MSFNHRLIFRTISVILLIEGLFMLPSMLLAFKEGTVETGRGFLYAFLALEILGGIAYITTEKHKVKMRLRESYYIVIICWFTVIAAGFIPYYLSGNGYSVIDSLFESVASWTTTAAWVLDINEMPKALVLWKATSNWLGGMGIILIAVLVLSALGVSGQKLAGAEVSGPELEKHTARMVDTVRLLYTIYIAASLLEFLLLRIGQVPVFDALINTMSTISTAGMLDYKGTIENYFNSYVKLVLVGFSILASLDFIIYVNIARKRFREALKDYEMHVFFIMIGSATLFCAVMLFVTGYFGNVFQALVNGAAGVVSFASTTGFPLEHVERWPSVCKAVLLLLMMVGGSGNSTAGGIKVIRFAVLIKLVRRGIYKKIHPRAVKPVLVRNVPVSAANVSSISTFILLYFGILLLSSVVLSFENLDLETTLAAPITLFSNCGVGFGQLAEANYTVFSGAGRLYCCLLMLMGRLEMYALLILFSRSFWRPDKA